MNVSSQIAILTKYLIIRRKSFIHNETPVPDGLFTGCASTFRSITVDMIETKDLESRLLTTKRNVGSRIVTQNLKP